MFIYRFSGCSYRALDTDKSIFNISEGSSGKEGVVKVNIVKMFYR
jgi:hypothetical protein